MDGLAHSLHDIVSGAVHIEWLSTVLIIVIVVVCAIIVSRLASRLLRRVLNRDDAPLPSSSIFINIVRIAVWAIAISIVLSSCFNVDVSSVITALGIGGIAVSLGFQDTLSNLISGVQVSVMGLVKPGDNINVDNQTGIVSDVTWRHTVITNNVGESVVIPNSVINKSALVKLRPRTVIVVPLVVTEEGDRLGEIAGEAEAAATDAAEAVGEVKDPAHALFFEVTDYGYKGTLTLEIADEAKAAETKNAVLRAVAPFMH